MKHEQLHTLLEQETRNFCEATLAVENSRAVPAVHYYHNEDPARTTNCGVATGSIQDSLLTHYSVETDRFLTEPTAEIMQRTSLNRRFSHVVLRHENLILDPTYGQLFERSGLDRRHPKTQATDYPTDLSLIVDLNDQDATLEPLAEALHETTHLDHAKESTFAPFRGIGEKAILASLRDLYNPENYTPFAVTPEFVSYDAIQGIIQMTEQLRKK